MIDVFVFIKFNPLVVYVLWLIIISLLEKLLYICICVCTYTHAHKRHIEHRDRGQTNDKNSLILLSIIYLI